MAKSAKKLNTDLDDSETTTRKSKKAFIDDSYSEPPAETPTSGDDVTYNMGDIQVSDAEETEAEDFKKASAKVMADPDEDEEGDWVDEELNAKDEDIFLDMDQDFDIDNPYSGDEY